MFRKYIIPIVLIPLLVFVLAVSFYRFIYATDYLVSYEGSCDYEVADCYVDCEDEECISEYYYTIIERHHNTIFELCGSDITDCEAANNCLPNEDDCTVNYCDPETEAELCETFNQGDL